MDWCKIIVFICHPAFDINIRCWCHQSYGSIYAKWTCHWHGAVSAGAEHNSSPHSQVMVKAHIYCLEEKKKNTPTNFFSFFRAVGRVESGTGSVRVRVSLRLSVCVLTLCCTFADELSASPQSPVCRGQREMSRVTDAPFARRVTPDPPCNEAGGRMALQSSIKSPSTVGVNASHYGTIGFLV